MPKFFYLADGPLLWLNSSKGKRSPMHRQNELALKILAPTRYPWRFNGPRYSRHSITNRAFLPMNKIDERIEGFTVFAPSLQRFDLVHAFNRIPIGRTPYLIGFESHLPRAFSLESTAYFRALSNSLAGERCKGIIAISRFSEQIFRKMHAESNFAELLDSKLEVQYPNIEIPDFEDSLDDLNGQLRLVFIGHHFARKGGCVAVKLAELGQKSGIDLHITIVSNLSMGGGIWTDPIREDYYLPWIKGLEQNNISHYKYLSNQEVQCLLRESHFCLLPTFGDTFGYSAIESMVNYCPMIATRQGALPEFIQNDINGILLDLPVDSDGQWTHISSSNRHTANFERMFTDEVERLAEIALRRIIQYANDPIGYRALRKNARHTAESLFSATQATQFWDNRYEKAVG